MVTLMSCSIFILHFDFRFVWRLEDDGSPAANSAGSLSRRERGWGEGLQSNERSFPPHPHPLQPNSGLPEFGHTINVCRSRKHPTSAGEREPPALEARPSIASCCSARLPLIYCHEI